MFRKILIVLAMGFGVQATALDFSPIAKSLAVNVQAQDENVGAKGLPWIVGETADYNLNVGGFLPGTMKVLVRELTKEGFWVEQNIDVLIQKQKIEILFDKDTGEVKEIRVDGQKQEPQAPGEVEIVESRPDSVTVPAGTFECAYIKLKDKKENKESEVWVNPEIIPIFGLIKTVDQSQMGPVTIELTRFLKK